MSRSVDLFIDPGVETHQLLVMLGSATHGAPVETTDGRWRLRVSDRLIAHVSRHSFVDDGELQLSRYPWVVSIRAGHEGSLIDHPATATAALRMVADDLRTHRCKVLLVLDLQYRLDLVAGQPSDDPLADGLPADGPVAGGPPAEERSGVEEPRPEQALAEERSGVAR